jgi:serine protease inhibitor
VLVNAIYFKGNWEYQFDPDKTKKSPFYISSENSVQVSMMKQEEQVFYAESESIQLLELPYVGNALSMLLLLPKRIDGLKQLEDSLSIENIELWRNNLAKTKVIISIPRFKMDYKDLLKKTLKNMGMVDAFIYPKANFAGMDGKSDWLFIDDVIHQAYVEVNEQGTEAAAATTVGVLGGMPSPPPTFRADHPFLFLIQENKTGNILFIGRLIDPTHSANS